MLSYYCALIALLSTCLAVDISGRIVLDTLPGKAVPIGSKVSLNHGQKSSLVLHDGSFTIHAVPEGEHLLEALVPGYSFPTTLYTINATSTHAQQHIPSRLPLPLSSQSLPLPLILVPGQDDYYTPANSVNILGMLRSPMVLMMLFSGVMMYAMPKMIASMEMDPDMAKDVAETRQKMQGMQNMDFMGSLSSMLAGETQGNPPPAVSNGATATGGNGGKKNKKR